eukprot:scaffold2898_cov114-Cylindrotheca_fusiformis.AAC.1
MITPSSAIKNPYSNKVVHRNLTSQRLPLNAASSIVNSPNAAPCKAAQVHHRDLQEGGVVPSRILLHDTNAVSSHATTLSRSCSGNNEDPDLKNNGLSTAATTSTARFAASNSTMKALASFNDATQQDCGRPDGFLSIKNTADDTSVPVNIPPPMLGKECNGLPQLNSKQAQAVQAIKDGKNVFLTGPAGTGKSVVLKHILDYLNRTKESDEWVAVAPTGTTAVALGGQTIHSFAGIGVPLEQSDFRKAEQHQKKWRALTFMILEEVSMISGEFLDRLNQVVSEIRTGEKDCQEPFGGGIQFLFCGDFLQLPPIEESPRHIAKRAAATRDMKKMGGIHGNRGFAFQNLVQPDFRRKDEDWESAEKELWQSDFFRKCIAERELKLKVGAQVMVVKNDTKGRTGLVNGSRGVVVGFSSTQPNKAFNESPPSSDDPENKVLYPLVRFQSGATIVIGFARFTSRIMGVGECIRVAIPLKLAWAITAQAYVALSRARDEKSLELKNFTALDVKADQCALDFYANPTQSDHDIPAWDRRQQHQKNSRYPEALANTQQDCGRFLSIKNTAATRHHPNDDDDISAPKNIPPPMLGEEGNGLPQLNSKQAQAVQAIKDGKNVFLTGPAGTGKSVVLKHILDYLKCTKKESDEWVAVAPTGTTAVQSDFRKAFEKQHRKKWRALTFMILEE